MVIFQFANWTPSDCPKGSSQDPEKPHLAGSKEELAAGCGVLVNALWKQRPLENE